MDTKVCTKCGIEKPATKDFFYKSGKYFRSECKVCVAEYHTKKWREKNPPVYEFPASKVCVKCQLEKPATSEHFGTMVRGKYGLDSNCKSCKNKAMKIYKQKPEVKKRRNKRHKERRQTDIQFKLTNNLRTRLWAALKGKTKSASTLELLGCTVEYLKFHLQSQFTEGMSWDNYGKNGWEIDHFIPIKSFDLTDPAQQRECFHWTNLQPLWAEDNRSKGAKLEFCQS